MLKNSPIVESTDGMVDMNNFVSADQMADAAHQKEKWTTKIGKAITALTTQYIGSVVGSAIAGGSDEGKASKYRLYWPMLPKLKP